MKGDLKGYSLCTVVTLTFVILTFTIRTRTFPGPVRNTLHIAEVMRFTQYNVHSADIVSRRSDLLIASLASAEVKHTSPQVFPINQLPTPAVARNINYTILVGEE